MALDFTLPPELRDLLDRVRAYVEEVALPAEAEIADPADLLRAGTSSSACATARASAGSTRRTCRRRGAGSGSGRSGWR